MNGACHNLGHEHLLKPLSCSASKRKTDDAVRSRLEDATETGSYQALCAYGSLVCGISFLK